MSKSRRSVSELLKSSRAKKFINSSLDIDLIETSNSQRLDDVAASGALVEVQPTKATLLEQSEKQTSGFQTSEIRTADSPPAKELAAEPTSPQQSEKQTSGFQMSEIRTANNALSKELAAEPTSLQQSEKQTSGFQTSEIRTANNALSKELAAEPTSLQQSEKQTSGFQTSEIQTANNALSKELAAEPTSLQQSEKQTSGFQTSEIQTANNALSKELAAEPTSLQQSEKQTSGFQTSEIQTANNALSKELAAEPTSLQQSEKQTSGFQTAVGAPTKKPTAASVVAHKQSEKRTSDKEGPTFGQNESEQVLSFGGFFPLSCQIFAPQIFHELKPGELKILLYLLFLSWRYPERPGYVRAALPYLERGTGITRSAVHDHLRNLIERGYVRCHEKNTKIGNLYFVSDSLLWKSEKKTAGKQTAENCTAAVQNSDGSSTESRLEQSEIRTEELDLLDSLDSSKLSLQDPIARYLSEIKAVKKRESERVCFEQLKQSFSVAEIENALEFVRTKGTLSGEKCHSPFSYLSKAGSEVIDFLNGQNQIKKTDSLVERLSEATKNSTEREKADMEASKAVAWENFKKRFPNSVDLETKLAELMEQRVQRVRFYEPKEVTRNLAVVDWYSALSTGGEA